jgi:hypothetical protein
MQIVFPPFPRSRLPSFLRNAIISHTHAHAEQTYRIDISEILSDHIQKYTRCDHIISYLLPLSSLPLPP